MLKSKSALLAGIALSCLTACVGIESIDQTKIDSAAQHSAKTVTDTDNWHDSKLHALDDHFAKAVKNGDVPGVSYMLVQGGEMVIKGHHGTQSWSPEKPMGDDTIHRIYSMTKPITGVAMMILFEEGHWDLDDPVTKFIPEFADLKVQVKNAEGGWDMVPMHRPPTMREVMAHTAGFGYGLFGDDPANTAFRDQKILRSPDLETMIDKIAETPLVFQPGEKWAYSAAVDIQGAIIERISGQSLDVFYAKRIFGPLGMGDTGFYVPEAKYDRFADVYGYNPRDKKLVKVPFKNVQYKKDTIALYSGGGGLVGTMEDYGKFSQMMLNNGSLNGARILKPETVQLMRENHAGDVEITTSGTLSSVLTDGLGFGLDLGLFVDPEKANLPYGKGSYYWGGAAGTWFWIDPENDLFFIGMIQIFNDAENNRPDVRSQSAKLVYDAMK